MKTTARLENIAKGSGALPPAKLKQLRAWIDDDWESNDIDRDVVKIINRLLLTIEENKALPKSLTYKTPDGF